MRLSAVGRYCELWCRWDNVSCSVHDTNRRFYHLKETTSLAVGTGHSCVSVGNKVDDWWSRQLPLFLLHHRPSTLNTDTQRQRPLHNELGRTCVSVSLHYDRAVLVLLTRPTYNTSLCRLSLYWCSWCVSCVILHQSHYCLPRYDTDR